MKTLNKKDIINISSNLKGPKVVILSGVHGNEICGVKAIKEILNNKKFQINKGKITFIFANRRAINEKIRFCEENLNRCFLKNKTKTNSYEENLAKDLKKILNKNDICLDLHASFSKKSEPFIICENNAFNLIKDFPIKKVCSGFDEIEPGGTDYYMNLKNKIGICIECGYLGNNKSKHIAIQSVYSLLNSLEMYNYKSQKKEKEFLLINKIYYAKNNFILEKEFKDFEFLKKGELIGTDGKKILLSKNNGFILFGRNVQSNEKDKEAFLFGKKLYSK